MLITLERDPRRVRNARAPTSKRPGSANRVTVMIGDAAQLPAQDRGTVRPDFSGRRQSGYTGRCSIGWSSLLRPGGLLVTDNVLWSGEVVPGFVDPPQRASADTAAIAAYNQQLASDARLFTTFLPVGDGLALSVKQDPAHS